MKDYIVRATAAEGQVRAFAATTKETDRSVVSPLPQTVKVMSKDMLIIRMLCCRQRMESLMWEVLLESVFYRL